MNCKFCGIELPSNRSAGGHVVWCKSNPNVNNTKNKLKLTQTGKKHTADTRRRMSENKKIYLDNNPDKVPYRLYHSSIKSFPEMTFEKYLKLNNIKGWVYNYRFGRYSFDFAFPEWQLDIEIDGKTHLNEKVKNSDMDRDLFVTNLGWRVIRFTAADIRNNVYECINRVLLEISWPKLIDIPEEFINKKKKSQTIIAKKQILIKNKEQRLNNNKRKIEINQIIKLYGNKFGIINKISKSLCISHTTVRRFCTKNNIEIFNRKN